jgi:hypothetical protein
MTAFEERRAFSTWVLKRAIKVLSFKAPPLFPAHGHRELPSLQNGQHNHTHNNHHIGIIGLKEFSNL